MTDEILQGEPIYYSQELSHKFKELLLIPISDLHYGNPLYSERHFKRMVDFIESTPNAYAILNGDLIEAATRKSKGDVYNQLGTPMKQAKAVADKLERIKDRLLGMTMGNHELRIYNEVGDDLCEYMAEKLNIPYRAEGILLKISFGNYNNYTKGKPFVYFVYATHGYGGARTKAAKAIKVERLGTWLHADCYIMSHDHVVNVAPDVYLMPDNRTRLDLKTGFRVGAVKAHRKMLVKSNAYLKWGGYSEMGGFPPVDLESPIIKLAGIGKPKVKVEV